MVNISLNIFKCSFLNINNFCISEVLLFFIEEKTHLNILKICNTNNLGKKVKSFDHVLLVQLLAWFKREFFSWVDKPKCENCSQPNVLHVG